MESRHLAKSAAANKLSSKKFQIVPGVDQLGMLLVTRAINELKGSTPKIYVEYAPGKGGSTIPLYSDESVHERPSPSKTIFHYNYFRTFFTF